MSELEPWPVEPVGEAPVFVSAVSPVACAWEVAVGRVPVSETSPGVVAVDAVWGSDGTESPQATEISSIATQRRTLPQ